MGQPKLPDCGIEAWNAWRVANPLTGVTLTGANLTRATLMGANLTRANLTGADLTGADLTGADLTRADLTGADLTRANLTRADLTDADLTRARWDALRNIELFWHCGPQGSRNAKTLFMALSDGEQIARTGCFSGTVDTLESRAAAVYGPGHRYALQYAAACACFRSMAAAQRGAK